MAVALCSIPEAACCAGRCSGFRNRPGQFGGTWRAQRSRFFPVWENFYILTAGKTDLAPPGIGPQCGTDLWQDSMSPPSWQRRPSPFLLPSLCPKFPLVLQVLSASGLSHTVQLPLKKEGGGRPPLLLFLPVPPAPPPEPPLKAGLAPGPLAVAASIPPLEAHPSCPMCL